MDNTLLRDGRLASEFPPRRMILFLGHQGRFSLFLLACGLITRGSKTLLNIDGSRNMVSIPGRTGQVTGCPASNRPRDERRIR